MKTRLLFFVPLALLLPTSAVSQTGPTAGNTFPLSATIDSSGVVMLYWSSPSAGQVEQYYLFRASLMDPLKSPDASDFVRIDSLAASDSLTYDRPPVDSALAFAYIMQARFLDGWARSNVATVPSHVRNIGPPIHLSARVNALTGSPLFTVDLAWKLREDVHADRFVLHRSLVRFDQDMNQLSFIPIDTLENLSFATDTPPVQDAPGFAYVLEASADDGSPIRSNIAFVYYRARYGFSLNAAVQDSGRVFLDWPPIQDSLAVKMFLIRRGPGETATHGALPPVIDSVAGVDAYIDRPPVPVAGGSFVYMITAQLTSGVALHSAPAVVYFRTQDPPQAFRMNAAVIPPDTIRMVWDEPPSTIVVKYYIHASFTDEQTPTLSPTGLRVIDSTSIRTHRFTAPASARYGIVAVTARTTTGRLIPSNSVPLEVPGRRLEPPQLSGEVTDTGTVVLSLFRPASIAGSMVHLYRHVVDTPGVHTFAYPWTLIDSTTADRYVDTPPSSEMGVVYSARVRVSGILLESTPFLAILKDRIYLQAIHDLDGTIRLEWLPVLRSRTERFVVERQVLTDSLLTVDPEGGTVLDTVHGTQYRYKPAGIDARGFAFRITAMSDGGPVRSLWRVVRWHGVAHQSLYLTARTTIKGTVLLTWSNPFQAPPRAYHIYRTKLARNTSTIDPSAFSLLDSLPGSEHSFEDNPPIDQSNTFAYRVGAVAVGPITLSNPVAVILPQQGLRIDLVRITSEPERSAEVGVTYTYRPRAVSIDTHATFHWVLAHGPQGMTIDSLTGIIEWLPFTRGLYRVVIEARSSTGGRAVQEYPLAVAAGVGTVSGTVYDPAGNPLPHVLVRLFKRDAETPFEYVRVTDSVGTYSFAKVEIGSYVSRAVDLSGTLASEWWYDKASAAEADRILVAEHAQTVVDFMLESRAVETRRVNVSGTVSFEDGSPMSDAVVVLARVEYLLNSSKHLSDGIGAVENVRDVLAAQMDAAFDPTGLTRQISPVVTTVTDGNGVYVVDVAPGAYIALAYAESHRKVFYDQKTDLLRADILRIVADTTGIDFMMSPLPDGALGGISGTVYDTSRSTPVPSRVIAFRFPGDNRRIESFYADTESDGAYTLPDLPPGEYVILALPLGHHVPSFYSTEGPTFAWRRAARVRIEGAFISGLNIFVPPMAGTTAGFTSISGAVAETGGVLRTLGGASATPVDGSLVYAMTDDGAVAGYALTDATGSYAITDLAPGSYTVTTDRFGYLEPTIVTVQPTYDEQGNPLPAEANLLVAAQTTGVSLAKKNVPRDYVLGQNFPNPFNPTTDISYAIPRSEHVRLSVFNILGQEIAILVDAVMAEGTHTARWNGQTLTGGAAPTGVYFYVLKTDAWLGTKRMVLLK